MNWNPRSMAADAMTAVVVACAVIMTGLRLREATRAPSPPREPEVVRVKDWTQFASGGHRLGSPQTAVTIVEFADFQCPFCAKALTTLRTLRRTYPEDVSVVYRHFPGHDSSFAAAVVSECAAERGKFEPMHDLLFRRAALIGVRSWNTFAAEAGITDTIGFARCLADPSTGARVARDTAAAHALGVRGTPTFIVNGKMFTGFTGSAQLRRLVEEELHENLAKLGHRD